MRIHNVHERTLPIGAEEAWALLENLGGPDDRLWPADRWPALHLDPGVVPGASGRHGFIRYTVAGVEPGRRIRFRVHDTPGLEGEHGFELLPVGEGASLLRHVVDADARGVFALYWWAVVDRLHNAIVEDVLDRAEGRPARAHDPFVRVARAIGRYAPVRPRTA